jgi:hypothetical protein
MGNKVIKLFGEADLKAKSTPLANENKFPEKKKVGRPKTHGLSRSPTYTSFHEARRRCTDPTHDNYANYGGRGIKFRFQAIDELVAAIGLRPEGRTLDRIDPEGHYEPANVRWATHAEQAQNRRNLKRAFSDDEWRFQANRWLAAARYYNTGEVPPEVHRQYLERREDGTPAASFGRLEPVYDDPGKLLLPGLTDPRRPVCLVGGPFGDVTTFRGPDGEHTYHFADSDKAYVAGMGMHHRPLELNLSSAEIDLYWEVFDKPHAGPLCLTGEDSAGKVAIEGRLMTFAAKLAFGNHRKIMFEPLVRVVKRLKEGLGSLGDGTLIIPDLNTPFGNYQIPPGIARMLADILQYRAETNQPTIIYSASISANGRQLEAVIRDEFQIRNLNQLPCLDAPVWDDDPDAPPGCEAEPQLSKPNIDYSQF